MRTSTVAALLSVSVFSSAACLPSDLTETWKCDFDSSVSRPLSNRGAVVGEGGALPAAECQSTCGPPVVDCTAIAIDGGGWAVNCPVCTF